MVCGSDKLTYPTICSLNEEAMRRGDNFDKFNPQLTMEYWGPCKEGIKKIPQISTVFNMFLPAFFQPRSSSPLPWTATVPSAPT